MADNLIDEIFVALGFKVNYKELDKYEKKIKKTLNDTKGFAKDGKGGKNLNAFLQKFKQFNAVLPKAGGAVAQVSRGLSALGGVAGPVAGGVIAVATAIVSTTVALDKMAMSLAKNNQLYINFNRQTGLSIDKLNTWAGAAALSDMNLDVQQISSGIQSLQSRLAEIRLTGQGAAEFQMLGISPWNKDAFDVLEQLRGRLGNMDPMLATNFVQKLGLSPEFVTLLRMSGEEFEKLARYSRQFQLSIEDQRALNKYGIEFKKLSMQWKYFGDQVLLKSMPVLFKVSEALTNFAVQYSNMYRAMWKLNVMRYFWESLGTILKPVGSLLREIWVILEDFAVWIGGGKSVVGKGLEGFEKIMTRWKGGLSNFGNELIGRPTGGAAPIDVNLDVTGGMLSGEGYAGSLPGFYGATSSNTYNNGGNISNKVSYNQSNTFNVTGVNEAVRGAANQLEILLLQADTVV